jgi:beta-1,4-mannosyltransferase
MERTAASACAPAVADAVGVAAFPLVPENPYQQLLYRHAPGLVLEPNAEFTARWLLRSRSRVRVAHFHWPQNHYAWWRGPAALRPALGWPKLGVFAARLALARLLGYRIAWTIHEVDPHEPAGWGLDRAGGRLLVRFAHVLLAHDEPTAEKAQAVLGAGAIVIVPHGSYVGVYPEGRPREEVRTELGVAPDAVLFLCFGHVRSYKGVELLLEAFARLAAPSAALLIAGPVVDEAAAEAVRRAAAADPRIVPLLGYVPSERVAELHAAADAAVLPRGDGGTSGALLLALTLGVPPVVARRPAYEELLGGGACGWAFEPGDAASLAEALAAAAGDAPGRVARAASARAAAQRLSWGELGARTAAAVTGAG